MASTTWQYRPGFGWVERDATPRVELELIARPVASKPAGKLRTRFASAALAALAAIGAVATTADATEPLPTRATMSAVAFTSDYGTYCHGFRQDGARDFRRTLVRTGIRDAARDGVVTRNERRFVRIESRAIVRIHRIECAGGQVWEDGSFTRANGATGSLRWSYARSGR